MIEIVTVSPPAWPAGASPEAGAVPEDSFLALFQGALGEGAPDSGEAAADACLEAPGDQTEAGLSLSAAWVPPPTVWGQGALAPAEPKDAGPVPTRAGSSDAPVSETRRGPQGAEAVGGPLVAEVFRAAPGGGAAGVIPPAASQPAPIPPPPGVPEGPGALDEGALGSAEARSRSERLWGFWLRARPPEAGAGRAGGAGGGPPQGAAAEVTPLPAGAEFAAADPDPVTLVSIAPRPPDEGPDGGERVPKATPAPGVGAPGAETGRLDGPEPASRSAEPPRHFPGSPAAQVAHGVRLAVARGGDRVTVQLEPEHLGKVHLVLTRDGGGVAAHFRVETPQAQQALSGEMPVLRQALESKGIPLVQVRVDLSDDRPADRGADQRPGSRRRRPETRLAGVDGIDESEPRPGAWRAWGFEARA